jgi:hypothetical protein
MARSTVSALAILAALACPAEGADPPVVLDKAIDYPHAGISLASPKGFEARPLENPYDVVNAVVLDNDRPIQAVTLSAFPVAGSVSAEAFADSKMAELRKNLAIRHLKLLKKTPMPVAGLNGSARLMSYTFRGAKTLAAQVYFMREGKEPEVRICYLLTVVCSADKQPRLLPTLGAVVRSAQLTAVRHPDLSGASTLGETVEDASLGYALRRPARWYAVKSAVGAEMGQVDYLLAGASVPSVHLLAQPITGDEANSEAFAKKSLGVLRSVAIKRKQTCEVLAEGPAKMAGLPAYQFAVVPSTAKQPALPRSAKSPPSVVIVQRTVCVPGGDTPRAYLLTLTARSETAQAAQAFMDKLVGGFRLVEPATQPTTQPTTAPATRPTTRPSTRPARP